MKKQYRNHPQPRLSAPFGSRLCLLLLLCLGTALSGFSQSNTFYYTFNNQTIGLVPVAGKYLIEYAQAPISNAQNPQSSIGTPISQRWFITTDTTNAARYGRQYKVFPTYITNSGTPFYITSEMVLKFKPGVSTMAKNDLINTWGLRFVKAASSYELYTVAGTNTLAVSRRIYESNQVIFSHPNFIGRAEKLSQPNDTYFSKQWYLHNTGQVTNDGHAGTADADIDAPEAWDITKGSAAITIAVVDEGVTSNHPDLPNTRQVRLNGSNFAGPYDSPTTSVNDPSPLSNDDHGNSCAGIIGATQDNNEGVTGVAPWCKIMPVRIPFTAAPVTVYADAIEFAHDQGARIQSHSWGYSFSSDPNLIPAIVSAMQYAISGGSKIFFAAGNTANHAANDPGYAIFPGCSSVEGLITVGASTRDDQQANYSPTDELIEITAPSHTAYDFQISGESFNIWTIDIPGSPGYNTWHESWAGLPAVGELLPATGPNNLAYTGRMGGTSAATPIVAGIGALMLSVNPCLSTAQMKDMLQQTTDKVGGYNYNWNAAGMPGHSKELGYGRANAFKAVQAAQQAYTSGLDLYIKDVPNEFGAEPDNIAQYLWVSDDIWVRNQADGVTNHTHQNPLYRIISQAPNYVYVRVRNKGCQPSAGNELLKLYWAKAATDLFWPSHWNGLVQSGQVMGNPVGTVTIPVLAPGEETILQFQWNVPNPADYQGINPEPWHFCLLGRIEATNDPMTYPEGQQLWLNVKNNNNIGWKNVTVVPIMGRQGGNHPGGVIAVGNPARERAIYNLEMFVPQDAPGNPITKEAEVRLTLDKTLLDIWRKGGARGANIKEAGNNEILITGPHATLENLEFDGEERGTVNVYFNFLSDEATPQTDFPYHVVQVRVEDKQVIGGELYLVQKDAREKIEADAGNDKTIYKNESVTITAVQLTEPATYNWYDTDGNLVYTGESMTVAPEVTQKYKLEVIALADGYKDYSDVQVTVKRFKLHSLFPNPASNQVTVEYDAKEASSAYLMVLHSGGRAAQNYMLSPSQSTTTLNIAGFQPGIYTVALVCDGVIVDAETLSVQ